MHVWVHWSWKGKKSFLMSSRHLLFYLAVKHSCLLEERESNKWEEKEKLRSSKAYRHDFVKPIRSDFIWLDLGEVCVFTNINYMCTSGQSHCIFFMCSLGLLTRAQAAVNISFDSNRVWDIWCASLKTYIQMMHFNWVSVVVQGNEGHCHCREQTTRLQFVDWEIIIKALPQGHLEGTNQHTIGLSE